MGRKMSGQRYRVGDLVIITKSGTIFDVGATVQIKAVGEIKRFIVMLVHDPVRRISGVIRPSQVRLYRVWR